MRVDINGVDRVDVQVGGDILGRAIAERGLLEAGQDLATVFELFADARHGQLEDGLPPAMLAILLARVGLGELGFQVMRVDAGDGMAMAVLAAEEVADGIVGHGAEESAEMAFGMIERKARELGVELDKNILGQIVGVMLVNLEAGDVKAHQGLIELAEFGPGGGIIAGTDAAEEGFAGGLVHWAHFTF